MRVSQPVFVSQSSLKTHHPTFHTPGSYDMMFGLRMKCDPRHLSEYDCIELPRRHAEKFATPCLNCFKDERRK